MVQEWKLWSIKIRFLTIIILAFQKDIVNFVSMISHRRTLFQGISRLVRGRSHFHILKNLFETLVWAVNAPEIAVVFLKNPPVSVVSIRKFFMVFVPVQLQAGFELI